MPLPALVLASLALQQAPPPAAAEDLRTVEVVLDEQDPVLAGHGVCERVEYEVRFSGMLQAWTRTEDSFDTFLRVEDGAGKLLHQDDDLGGKPTPYLEFAVEPGQRLVILVAAAQPGLTGKAELRLRAFPDTELTRKAASDARAAFAKGQALEQQKDFPSALAEIAAAIRALLSTEGLNHSVPSIKALYALGWQAWKLGDLESSVLACGAVVEDMERAMPPDQPSLLQARGFLAWVLRCRGQLAQARILGEQVLASRLRTLPEDHPDVLTAQHGLAWTLRLCGELQRAKELAEHVLEVRTRILKDDDSDLQWSRSELAKVLGELGELERARELQEQALAVRERASPPNPLDLAWARSDLGWTLGRLGELQRAKELQELVLEARESTLPEDHFDLQSARANLAATLLELGEARRAQALQERVLEVQTRVLAPGAPDIRAARNNLALTLRLLGDLTRSKMLLEQVVAEDERSLPNDAPVRLHEHANLADTLLRMGDAQGARALIEPVLAIQERILPEGAPDLGLSIHTLANIESSLGHPERAVELFQRLIATQSRTLPPGHRDLLSSRGGLGWALFRAGDREGARAEFQAVAEVRARTEPAESPLLAMARLNLGSALLSLGRMEEVRTLTEQILAEERSSLVPGSGLLQGAHLNQLLTCLATGERSRAEEVGLQLARDVRASLEQTTRSLAPREAEASALAVRGRIAAVVRLALAPGDSKRGEELARAAFELVESVRSVPLASRTALRAAEGGGELGAKAARLRKQIQDASGEIAAAATSGAGTAEEFQAALRRKESAERALGETLAARGSPGSAFQCPSLATIAAALAEHEFVVAFSVHAFMDLDPDLAVARPADSRLLAAVAGRAARVRWIDLGPEAKIAAAADRWRKALSAPIPRGTAVSEGPPRGAEEEAAGAELAQLLVAPLLAACPDATRWYVANDDVLHLVPLDALPDGTQVLGDRLQVLVRPDFARFPGDARQAAAAPLLVAMGAIEFDGPSGPAVAIAPASAQRSRAWDRSFAPLPETQQEVRTVEALFHKSFPEPAQVRRLEQREATKQALRDLAPQLCFLHLATHGYFERDSVASLEDRAPASRWVESQPFVERVQGLSPWVLCGLALAGANEPPDALGRLRGVITAEEVAALDLSHCELAVLSACDTNTGIRRAGQGVASLQAALHAAGARSAISSLWRVPDEATRELMVDFYHRIWVEKKPKAQALWEAKSKLRKQKDENGRPKYATRDWAGWVLSGDPR